METPRLPANASCRLLVIFLFLGLADFFLTWKLLTLQDSDVIESNPLAAAVLNSAGWVGLGCFKLTLMLLIYGLAMLIERRRAFGGYFILVFGCGVQASIVITSIFMFAEKRSSPETAQTRLHNGIVERSTLPTASIFLLGKPSVQVELGLTSAQVAEFAGLIKERQDICRLMLSENLEDWQNRLSNLTVREQTFVFQDLRPEQFKRLQQICWQYRGSLTVCDLEFSGDFDLNSDQIELIQPLVDKASHLLLDGKNANVNAADSHREITRIKTTIWSALTDRQREVWKSIAGPAFVLDDDPSLRVANESDQDPLRRLANGAELAAGSRLQVVPAIIIGDTGTISFALLRDNLAIHNAHRRIHAESEDGWRVSANLDANDNSQVRVGSAAFSGSGTHGWWTPSAE